MRKKKKQEMTFVSPSFFLAEKARLLISREEQVTREIYTLASLFPLVNDHLSKVTVRTHYISRSIEWS